MEEIGKSLYSGNLIRLSPFDPESDAEIEARWYRDTELLALTEREPIRPLTAPLIRKRYTEEEKDKRSYVAAVRTREDNRLVGRASLKHIDHALGNTLAFVLIGHAEDRGKGYGTEALQLLLRYGFDELNLSRVGAEIHEFNADALRWLQRAGFKPEVRRREALYRAGKRWDVISVGLLREEWVSVRKDGMEARRV